MPLDSRRLLLTLSVLVTLSSHGLASLEDSDAPSTGENLATVTILCVKLVAFQTIVMP